MSLEFGGAGAHAVRDEWLSQVRPVVAQIRAQETGRIILADIERSPRVVRIVPFNRDDYHDWGFNNAVTYRGNPSSAGTLNGSPAAGTGAEVHFSVGNVNGRGVQMLPDEVLCHELCHAVRCIRGVMDYSVNTHGNRVNQPMSGGFDTVEEFFAAMVTSVYSSQLHRPPLGNHRLAILRDPRLLRRPPYSTRLRDFWRWMRDFLELIAAIPAERARFNPFRDIQV